ncbi:hypothetical protein CLV84_1761 [Neolewinella xylanilytica]|uniref:Uncharacterized protein n=1 Tax=Neolewinella xylanilytica TaxID=1514080 RepID=A0A2S6IBF9_9BACT|nr:hypothetical protein [Neolewinella xylanilytica]PPK88789.1 hypothetical protein CLV84_1761 [Neolewinella xylanilytica]
MSVKISRREEKRATPLRDFLLAATLPLLLAGMIGYVAGRAATADTGINRAEVQRMQERAERAEAQLAEQAQFVEEVDSLTRLLVAARDARKEEFSQIVAQGGSDFAFGQDPLSAWTKQVRQDLTTYSQAMNELQGSIAGRDIIEESSIVPITHLYDNLIEQCGQYFNDQRRAYQAMNDDQKRMSESIAEQEEVLDDELEDLQTALDQAKRKLEIKDERINLLNSQLAQSGDVPPPVSFQAEKATIKGATVRIEAISRQLPTGVVGKRKVAEIEAEILTQVGLIESALEIIE